MALVHKTVALESGWTFITNEKAMLQFNDEMFMMLTSTDTAPKETTGFLVKANDFFINPIVNSYVWVKSRRGGTEVESVRIVEDLV